MEEGENLKGESVLVVATGPLMICGLESRRMSQQKAKGNSIMSNINYPTSISSLAAHHTLCNSLNIRTEVEDLILDPSDIGVDNKKKFKPSIICLA